MYDTTIAAKLLKQLESFLGRISPHFHKPVARFIGDMIYGIMAEKDVKLSSIVRALKEKTTPKKVEDRLSRMLSSDMPSSAGSPTLPRQDEARQKSAAKHNTKRGENGIMHCMKTAQNPRSPSRSPSSAWWPRLCALTPAAVLAAAALAMRLL